MSALATYVILVEHYAQYAMSRCDRIEVVSSTQVDHCFVRVWLRDGSCVIHDHWINPEAFLPEDGRFSTVNDLIVVAVWRPGDGVQFRWEDLKRQARSLGEIRDVELPPEWQPFLGNSSSSDLVSYAKRKILTNGRKDRTETDCLLTREQAAQKGMQPNEQVVYHHRGHYYSNDIVAESSIERLDEPADRPKFPELHLQQAQWELEVEGACVRQDRQELTRLLQRTDVRQWFPERHRDLCLGATNTALCGPLDERNMALIGELYKNAIDASTATQMNMMLRMRMIDDALKNRDRPALTRWLNTQSLAACGDQGSRWLMMACMHLDVRGVRRLLKAGAQFGASHGLENGLSLAIQAGGADMVKLLLRRGASALRPNGVGLVAWEFAQQMLRDAHAAGGDVARQREVAAIICGEAVAQAIALQPSNLALLETLRAGIDDEALRDNLTLAVEMIEHAQADSAQEGLQ
ncbi:hypothetical protein ASE08_13555 [Rhizobacter sp. Root16D2]|nr:hypothetical protein ASC88_04570 [Rhizobacter sp. Root29]KQV98676.1 hypothetical protein ASC98_08400 [Rhizobacter sp. Root1238]KRB04929.1 hypothetical protein ASE08_13555 [Rhizobacter sp. Root16D2]